ncbi:hypothetical protein HK104_005728 [Borealophlyctis nickersoniae]|nr:hypothetical protein HK104_005728 [Borealophlyctis nickersoniae]
MPREAPMEAFSYDSYDTDLLSPSADFPSDVHQEAFSPPRKELKKLKKQPTTTTRTTRPCGGGNYYGNLKNTTGMGGGGVPLVSTTGEDMGIHTTSIDPLPRSYARRPSIDPMRFQPTPGDEKIREDVIASAAEEGDEEVDDMGVGEDVDDEEEELIEYTLHPDDDWDGLDDACGEEYTGGGDVGVTLPPAFLLGGAGADRHVHRWELHHGSERNGDEDRDPESEEPRLDEDGWEGLRREEHDPAG